MTASSSTLKSPYDKRVQLVHDAITANSEVGDKAADELAVQILHALDSIPEKMR